MPKIWLAISLILSYWVTFVYEHLLLVIKILVLFIYLLAKSYGDNMLMYNYTD